ncbi:MAG: ABC transporter permease [Gammaproteobacteria bacterium]|nr:ABC transporter permease [Gammaproteobacteria bacterium]
MLFLATRHLLSRKRQTTLILLGICLGTMVYVIISGLQLGMREFILDRLLNNTPHIKISARDRIIDKEEMTQRFFHNEAAVSWIIPPSGKREELHIQYPQGWFDRLSNNPDVASYTSSLNLNVIISHRDNTYPGNLGGIEPLKQIQVTALEDYMVEGSFLDLTGGGNKLIVGDGVLERLGVRRNDSIKVSTGSGEARPFKIVGVLKLGIKEIDETLMFAALKDVQQLNKTPGRISEIWVKLFDLNRSGELAQAWELLSRETVEGWEESNSNFLQIFTIQDIVRNTITVAILVVAGFGIYNVLSIMINQKRREIAILRSIGYPPRKILWLFLIQGIILGISGAAIGLLLGHLTNMYIETIDIGIQMGPHSTFLISRAPSIYIVGFALAIISSGIASILPAHAASKLTPIDIIRSEV